MITLSCTIWYIATEFGSQLLPDCNYDWMCTPPTVGNGNVSEMIRLKVGWTPSLTWYPDHIVSRSDLNLRLCLSCLGCSDRELAGETVLRAPHVHHCLCRTNEDKRKGNRTYLHCIACCGMEKICRVSDCNDAMFPEVIHMLQCEQNGKSLVIWSPRCVTYSAYLYILFAIS